MSELDKKILNNVGEVLPTMDQSEKDRLLSFTEGMAAMAQMRQEKLQDDAENNA